jgi:hypothetical protein
VLINTNPNAMANALAFARDGHAVLPLHGVIETAAGLACSCTKPNCPSPAKHPHYRLAKNGLKNATTAAAKICVWFDEIDNLNYGVRTDTLLVIDIDPRHDGDETWKKLERQHGEVPATRRVITGGMGQHIMFSMPKQGIPNAVGKLGPGVDVKGVGGYIVGPGCMHVSGRLYAWDIDHHPDEMPLAAVPEWIIAALTAGVVSLDERRSPEYWGQLASELIPDGRRHATLMSLIGRWMSRLGDPHEVHDIAQGHNLYRCHPPLEYSDVEEMVVNVIKRECKKRGVPVP